MASYDKRMLQLMWKTKHTIVRSKLITNRDDIPKSGLRNTQMANRIALKILENKVVFTHSLYPSITSPKSGNSVDKPKSLIENSTVQLYNVTAAESILFGKSICTTPINATLSTDANVNLEMRSCVT